MGDILRLYIAGFRDSLLCMNSIRDLLSSPELMKRTAQNTVINGVLYFGSVYLYSLFTSSSTKNAGGEQEEQESNIRVQGLYLVLRLVMGLMYNLWILFVYIVAMTLSTFWVQDIFDELIKIKLVRLYKQQGEGELQQSECQRIIS